MFSRRFTRSSHQFCSEVSTFFSIQSRNVWQSYGCNSHTTATVWFIWAPGN